MANYFLKVIANKLEADFGKESAHKLLSDYSNNLEEVQYERNRMKSWNKVLPTGYRIPKVYIAYTEDTFTSLPRDEEGILRLLRTDLEDCEGKQAYEWAMLSKAKKKALVKSWFDDAETNALGIKVIEYVYTVDGYCEGSGVEGTGYLGYTEDGLFSLTDNYLLDWDKVNDRMRRAFRGRKNYHTPATERELFLDTFE